MPQEFSQRYSDVGALGDAFVIRECRLQDKKNRQSSLPCEDADLAQWWEDAQREVIDLAREKYDAALSLGIAKEQARVILPEGNTKTRMYLNGNMRSWVHYLRSRLHPSTQKEHREIAQELLVVLREVAPVTARTFFGEAV